MAVFSGLSYRLPGEVNCSPRHYVLGSVPDAGTEARQGRLTDTAFVRVLYAEHGGALLTCYALKALKFALQERGLAP
jgi:hypothetical protein